MKHWRMVGKELQECSLEEWAKSWEDPDRSIGSDMIGDIDIHVSTVCLGMEHSGGIFETMIFGGEHDQYQERCWTYEQALEMHKTAVELVKSSN